MNPQSPYSFPFVRYPALRIAVLFGSGILMDRGLPVSPVIWSVLFTVLGLFFFLSNHLTGQHIHTGIYRLSIFSYLCLVIVGGAVWHLLNTSRTAPPSQILLDTYRSEQVTFKGKILAISQSSTGNQQLDLRIDTTRFNDSLSWYGNYKLRGIDGPGKNSLLREMALGSRLSFKATVYPLDDQRNPRQFNYQKYLASRQIYNHAGIDTILTIHPAPTVTFLPVNWPALRQITLDLIDQNFSRGSARLAKALLLGYKNELSHESKVAFSRTGLSHIMAVSGLHVGFLLAPFWLVTPFFWTIKYGKEIGLTLLVLLLIVYAGLTNFTASVTRASITGGFILYGRLFNRVRDMINLTSVAAIIILLRNPGELFEIGFQLSFGAVYIILLVMPVINRRLPAWIRYRRAGGIITIMLVSFVVQTGLFPLLSYYFHEFSLIGPLTNAIVVPILFIVVPWALILLAVSTVSPLLGSLLNIPNHWFLLTLDRWVTSVSGWRGSWIQTHVESPWIFLIWLVALFGIASLHIPRYRWKISCLFLGLLCLQQCSAILHKQASPSLEITVFDVGQGDAVLVQTPGDKHFLIDTGRWSPNYNSARHIIIPHLKAAGINRLEAVFLSHPHADHIGGISELIAAIPIDTIYNSGFKHHSNLYTGYLRESAEKGIAAVSLGAGDRVALDKNIRIMVYGPAKTNNSSDPNEHSLILELIYGETEFLFMGDAGKMQERQLIENYHNLLDTDFLKVGHHGSKTSSIEPFLNRATPDISVLSLKKYNRFRHPHSETILRLRKTNSQLYFTSLEGALLFTSNGYAIEKKEW